MAKEQTQNVSALTPETVEQLLALNPGVRDKLIESVDSEIDRLNGLRAALSGRKRGGGNRRSQADVGEVTDERTHGEAILHVLSLKNFKDGATSRELREQLAKSGHPMTSGTFGTTMQILKKNKEIKSSGERGSMVYKAVAPR